MTATTYLEWEDQTNGSNNNTWGDVSDANSAIFEQAIARYLPLSTTGGSTTLTSSQNRYPIIVVSGVLASNATIVVRTAEKNWTIKNVTTGNFTLTVKTAAGTGQKVPQGRALLLYCDGTDVQVARHQQIPRAAAAGTANAITATFSPAVTAADLIDGFLVQVDSSLTNTTTTPTFSPDSLTARTITKFGGIALNAGDISNGGHPLLLSYRSAGPAWELLNPQSASLGANNFTDNQTIVGTLTVKSNDAGATEGPEIFLDRNSASPAADDVLGAILYSGRSSTSATTIYARIKAIASIVTNAAEKGILALSTVWAGTEAARLYIGQGIYTAGAASGDMGADTFNATDYYRAGYKSSQIAASVSFDAATADNVAATYSQSGFTVTVTKNNHGYQVGHRVYHDYTSGTATDASYIVATITTNTYTVTDGTSRTTSGNVTLLRRLINDSNNIHSVTYNNVAGSYGVNFTNPLGATNYTWSGSAESTSATGATVVVNRQSGGLKTQNTMSFYTSNVVAGTNVDAGEVSLIFVKH